MKITIEAKWSPVMFAEMVHECWSVIRLLKHHDLSSSTFVLTWWMEVPVIIGATTSVGEAWKLYEVYSMYLDNKRQDMVDHDLASRVKFFQENHNR